MAKYGKDAAPVTSQCKHAQRDYVDRRAERLNWSRAEAITKIIEFWFAVGAPPLVEPECYMPAIDMPQDCREPLVSWWAPHIPTVQAQQMAAHILSRKPAAGRKSPQSSGESNHSARK